ncbi:E3 ubiquitin/ISG15 ligase TRIM25-like isoform X3 [Rhinichthys klamathensis goyatoka]|uniref:E3 ubiquitin/ISG15 ligase TRIM25-like isoform X3 n=1 Tax=Rhinichthys klamathensis goyatoka TaxID=3034132 RepID=UPI0024B629DC|nr:E3 ubiquitin/ISG15 ligase TRIM25-like isoform X3 [Rhinichthys klamathensis goyatoka]
MASSSGPSLNEELQCSICMEVFTDPVTTACGHNFCQTCLSKSWPNSRTCFCPLCKEKFSRRPKLKINTTLREVVQHFKEKLNLGETEVFCDFCDERKQKAVKTCLTCQSSYCETHLEPHLSLPCLNEHTLINAVENLEDYICQKHERPLELFCRDDQTCVCLSCTEGEHRTHNTVPIEEESREKKTDIHQMIQDRKKKIQEIQHSVELRKRNTEKAESSSVEIFTDLIRSIERCQSDLMKMMEEQQKAAEKQAEDLIKEIHQEITELKRRNTELEQLSHTDDHLHVIQVSSTLYTRPNTKNWTEIRIDSDVNVNSLFIALTELKNTLDETLKEKLSQTGM